MKPSSVVSLIIAAVIIAVGIVTCTVANNKAQKNGTPLFSEIRGDDSVNTVDLSGKDIIKLSLDFSEADVYISGTTGASYIEFINFPDSYSSVKVSNTSVSFSEITDITSIFKFWESGFSFKGMRYFLTPVNLDTSKKKSIYVYLSKDSGIKQFELNADKVALDIEKLDNKTDFILSANEMDLFTSSVSTQSVLRVNSGSDAVSAQKAKITLKNSEFDNVIVSAGELNFTATATYSNNATVTSVSGNVTWDINSSSAASYPANDPEISINTSGIISVNNGQEISPYLHKSSIEEGYRQFTFNLGSADITINIPIDVVTPIEE